MGKMSGVSPLTIRPTDVKKQKRLSEAVKDIKILKFRPPFSKVEGYQGEVVGRTPQCAEFLMPT